jgi:hypothetical protein
MMNFIAVIGTICEINNCNNNTVMQLKVENVNDECDIVNVDINDELLKEQLKKIKLGTLIGINGRVNTAQNKLHLICERIQVF